MFEADNDCLVEEDDNHLNDDERYTNESYSVAASLAGHMQFYIIIYIVHTNTTIGLRTVHMVTNIRKIIQDLYPNTYSYAILNQKQCYMCRSIRTI